MHCDRFIGETLVHI